MQFGQLQRREFITLVAGVMAWPVAARAQKPAMPVIGFLDGQSFDLYLMAAFRQALKDAGYVEDRDVAIYFRSGDGHTDRLVTLAGDVVGRRVAVIVTAGGGGAALAAYAATTTIPIVFVSSVATRPSRPNRICGRGRCATGRRPNHAG
jgi:putative ABC transport system substrate-binding protein